jgi:signal transduction histidine kinase
MGYLEILKHTNPSEYQKEIIDQVMKSFNQVLDVYDKTLDITKISSGSIKIKNNEINLEKILRDTVSNVLEQYDKNLDVNVNYDDDMQKLFLGDKYYVGKIIYNVVDNAIKFTEQGSVELNIHTGQEYENYLECFIDVKDTGVGILKDKQECIFEKLTQADESNVKKYGGMGLGLTISKELSERMGGYINVKSEYEQGSLFRICLKLNKNNLNLKESESNNYVI